MGWGWWLEGLEVGWEVLVDDILGDELPLVERLEVEVGVGVEGGLFGEVLYDECSEVGEHGSYDAIGELVEWYFCAELEVSAATVGAVAVECDAVGAGFGEAGAVGHGYDGYALSGRFGDVDSVDDASCGVEGVVVVAHTSGSGEEEDVTGGGGVLDPFIVAVLEVVDDFTAGHAQDGEHVLVFVEGEHASDVEVALG